MLNHFFFKRQVISLHLFSQVPTLLLIGARIDGGKLTETEGELHLGRQYGLRSFWLGTSEKYQGNIINNGTSHGKISWVCKMSNGNRMGIA